MTHTDTLFMNCHYGCGYRIEKTVDHDRDLPPSTVIRWHERMIAHVRSKHAGRRSAQA